MNTQSDGRTDEAGEEKAGSGFAATVLVVLGIVWMALTGLCTALFAGSSILSSVLQIISGENGPGSGLFGLLQSIFALLLIGVICIGPGYAIWRLGVWLGKRRAKRVP